MREELKHCPVCEATSFEEAVSTVDYSTSKEAFTVHEKQDYALDFDLDTLYEFWKEKK